MKSNYRIVMFGLLRVSLEICSILVNQYILATLKFPSPIVLSTINMTLTALTSHIILSLYSKTIPTFLGHRSLGSQLQSIVPCGLYVAISSFCSTSLFMYFDLPFILWTQLAFPIFWVWNDHCFDTNTFHERNDVGKNKKNYLLCMVVAIGLIIGLFLRYYCDNITTSHSSWSMIGLIMLFSSLWYETASVFSFYPTTTLATTPTASSSLFEYTSWVHTIASLWLLLLCGCITPTTMMSDVNTVLQYWMITMITISCTVTILHTCSNFSLYSSHIIVDDDEQVVVMKEYRVMMVYNKCCTVIGHLILFVVTAVTYSYPININIIVIMGYLMTWFCVMSFYYHILVSSSLSQSPLALSLSLLSHHYSHDNDAIAVNVDEEVSSC